MQGNGTLTETEWTIFGRAKPYLSARDNETHTLIVIDFAARLLQLEQADRTVVMPAAILHDIGWSRVPDDILMRAYGPRAEKHLTRLHEQEGARIAGTILRDVGYDAAKTADIVAIIDGHDTRDSALSPHDAMVKDADKLFRFTRAGFVAREKEFAITAQQNYDRLVRHLEEWLFLPTSKMMAKKELADRFGEIRASVMEVRDTARASDP